MPNLTIRLSEDDMATLDRLSSQWGLTRSDTVRKLIRDFDKAIREVREEACRTCGRLAATYLFESMILDPMVIYNLINANRDLVGDREFIVGWIVTSNHRVFFSFMDDLGRYLLKAAREYVRRHYSEREPLSEGGRRPTGKPRAQTRPPTPRFTTANSCYKVVVVYPDGTKYDVAEELHGGCKDEGTIEITPGDYQRYLRGEATLDELIMRYREVDTTQRTAGGGAANTQAQPQPSTQQAAQHQANTKPAPPNPPYWTLGEAAMRLGLLKLPKIINKEDATKGDP
jgi:hypothetical protein